MISCAWFANTNQSQNVNVDVPKLHVANRSLQRKQNVFTMKRTHSFQFTTLGSRQIVTGERNLSTIIGDGGANVMVAFGTLLPLFLQAVNLPITLTHQVEHAFFCD
jgi:hypothetical protein